jgi:hypothetical protein
MPNATVRADARTLPEGTNRRGLLGGILVAGATASLPAVAAASVAPSPSPDADLLALIERARIADEISTDACMAAADLSSEIAPLYPKALKWNESDVSKWFGVRRGAFIPKEDVDFLRKWLKLSIKPDPTKHDIGPMGPVVPTLDFVERAREIVKTHDEFEAARRAAKEHPDVLDAEARSEALLATWRELATRIATTPAKTPEGILAKVLSIASAYAEDDLDGTYDGILASLALDAQALSGRSA